MSRLRNTILGSLASLLTLQSAALATPRNAVSSLSCCNCKKLASRFATETTLNSAPLDFDGDGISELTYATRDGENTVFSFSQSSNGAPVQLSVPRGLIGAGDYDGDGKWDAVTIKQSGPANTWNIRQSSDGQLVNITFGNNFSRIITGCRLLSSGKHSIAVQNGRNVFATELGATVKKQIIFTDLANVDLIGCGDINGDRIDEVIFRSRRPRTPANKNEIATASCINDFITYRTLPTFKDAFVVPRGFGDSPSIMVQRPELRGNRVNMLESLFGTLSFYNLKLPAGTQFSSGFFPDGTNTVTPALVWLEPGGSTVQRRFVLEGAKTEATSSVRGNGSLVQPQYVHEASRSNK